MIRRIAIAILSISLVAGSAAPVFAATKAQIKQAREECKKKYGQYPTSVQFGKKDVTCVFGGKEMTRSEAYNWCRDKYHATSIIISKTKKGWLCRYYSQTGF